ncbi:MAG: tyrosine-type recombinase/integrase [Actinobacteria bacterium]|nr:tyrosine-type recombinase/integrase [Actinomycetota bacterium]
MGARGGSRRRCAARRYARRPGNVAAAWLMEFSRSNTRQAYATDLAAFFVWCAQRPVDVWAVRRHHLAEYLAQPKPDGDAFAPKTLERRLAAICGLYTYALDLGLIERHPRGHGKRLRVDAKRAQGAAALSKAEFERFVAAAREDSPNALAIVLLLGLYGLRVSEVCELQLEQLDWNHGQPVLRVAGKGRAANETSTFPVPHDVRQALLQAAGGRESGPLLVKHSARPYVRQEIAALLRTLCHRAQVQTRLTPHGLRATFITLALNDGAALRDVQDAARHADPRTTRLYDRDAGALNRHPVHRLLGLAGS